MSVANICGYVRRDSVRKEIGCGDSREMEASPRQNLCTRVTGASQPILPSKSFEQARTIAIRNCLRHRPDNPGIRTTDLPLRAWSRELPTWCLELIATLMRDKKLGTP